MLILVLGSTRSGKPAVVARNDPAADQIDTVVLTEEVALGAGSG